MGEQSAIQWTHHTFNPWSGCAKVHRGCTHCYAEALAPSMRRQASWGEVWQGGQRVVAAEGYWRLPLAWARTAALLGERQRVFCASTADVLEVPNLPAAWPRDWSEHHRDASRARVFETGRALEVARDRLWDTVRRTSACRGCGGPATCFGAYEGGSPEPGCDACCGHGNEDGWCGRGGLDLLLLTKRPKNWRLVPEDVRPLVWLGTSVSDQKTADEWVPCLLKAEGFRLRFLSVEPLTGPVDLRDISTWGDALGRGRTRPSVDWVIVGGESGRKAEPCQVEWVRDVARQCRGAGVPVFVKQLGAHYVDAMNGVGGVLARPPPEYGSLTRRLIDSKGGNMAEWPEDLRVRQLPEVRHG
jgi:protein gp37